ncbi:MAG TPA: glycosyltransferase family 2 protein [Solirubrobacteraceae bacterium]|nr:glycosyltransferase family 2 protein [Solirubrobacteraceae bacterium]
MFTHEGRREVLAQGLDSVISQIEADSQLKDVEICLTDNASHDGTEQLLAALKAEHDVQLRYRRHDHDLGLSSNLLSCVAMARGDYCWILTSDDTLEPGAIARVLELIAATRAPGVIVGKANFDFTMTEPTGQGGPDFYPPESRRTIRYDNGEDFLEDCGMLASLVSTVIVRRESWLAAVEDLGGAALHAQTTIFPHLPILALIAQRDPSWVWCPAKLVRARMGNAFMASDEGLDIEQIHVRLLTDMNRMWAERLRSKRQLRHALMRRAYRTFATPAVLRAVAPRGRSRRRAAALVLAYARIFWWSYEFWLRSVPALASDIVGRRAPTGRTSTPVLPLERRRARIRPVHVQHEVPNSHEVAIDVEVTNLARVPLCPYPPHRIVLGYRWQDRDGKALMQGPPFPVPRRIAPGASVVCRVDVLTPNEPGEYWLRIALAQEDVGWFDDRSPEHACSLRIFVRRYGWSDLP